MLLILIPLLWLVVTVIAVAACRAAALADRNGARPAVPLMGRGLGDPHPR